jgi:hypothetical protein
VNVNHQGKKILPLRSWNYYLKASECAAEHVNIEDLPDIHWLDVDQVTKDTPLRVLAARSFVKGEVVGLFWGKVIDTKVQPSRYALQSKYGIVDPLRGVTDRGTKFHGMAMHLVAEPEPSTLANAEILESFLVVALKPIKAGEEIFFQHRTLMVWPPRYPSE